MIVTSPPAGADRRRGVFGEESDRLPSLRDDASAMPVPRVIASAPSHSRLSILVPIRNEAENVAPLVTRLERALAGLDAEIVFIDDGDDDSAERVRRLAASSTVPLRLLARPPGQRD